MDLRLDPIRLPIRQLAAPAWIRGQFPPLHAVIGFRFAGLLSLIALAAGIVRVLLSLRQQMDITAASGA